MKLNRGFRLKIFSGLYPRLVVVTLCLSIAGITNTYAQSSTEETKDHEVYNDGKYLNVTVEEDSTTSTNKHLNKADSIRDLGKVDFKNPDDVKNAVRNKIKGGNGSDSKLSRGLNKADSVFGKIKNVSSLSDYQDDFINNDFLKDITSGKTIYDTLGLTGNNPPFADGPVGLDKIFGDEVDGMDKFKEQLDVMPTRQDLNSYLSSPPLEVLDTLDFIKMKDGKASKKLKGWKSKYNEHSSKVKELSFNKKALIPIHKMFFEGIISVPTSGFDNFGLTPQAGFKVNDRISGGVGLAFQYNGGKESSSPTMTLGYKAFLRYQIILERLYLQSETVFYHPRFSMISEGNSAGVKKDYSLLVGGGYEISLSSTKRLTFAMFYNLKKVSFVPGLNSPFVARIGLGMLK